MDATSAYIDEDWVPRRVETTSPWPVDMAHLARYSLGDKALEREVLGLFAGEAPSRVEALRQARTDKDWRMAAHTLKGSGRAVGAWRVANLAQQLESLGFAVDRDIRLSAIDQLAVALDEATAYIARL
ncbi:MAG: Hpt domain-containing protein [Hyphomicrobium sp.]